MSGFVGRNSRVDLLLAAVAILALLPVHGHAQTAAPPSGTIWTVPEVGALPDDDYGRLVRRGRDRHSWRGQRRQRGGVKV